MTPKTKVLIALLAALALATGGWLVTRNSQTESASKASEPGAPTNTVHEKAFLVEQLRTNPNHVPILLRLAQLERGDNELASAKDHLQLALRQGDGDQVDVHLELGLVLSELGDVPGAEAQNQAVLKLSPDQPDALYNLGAIYANRGEVIQARRYWSDAVRLGGNSDSAGKSRQALERLNSGK